MNKPDNRPHFGQGLRTIAHGTWRERCGQIAQVREYRPISSQSPWVGTNSDGEPASWKNNGQWCIPNKKSPHDLVKFIAPPDYEVISMHQITPEWLQSLGFEKEPSCDQNWYHNELELELWELEPGGHSGVYFWSTNRKVKLETREAVEALMRWLRITK